MPKVNHVPFIRYMKIYKETFMGIICSKIFAHESFKCKKQEEMLLRHYLQIFFEVIYCFVLCNVF